MQAEPVLYGTDLFGDPIQPPKRGKLAEDFLVPPFTVLNSREGWWQERKRGWLSHGIRGEVGRDARCFGQDLMKGEHVVGEVGIQDEEQTGTSVFDPVLCELAYRWWCPPGGLVLDPFAGGSVRGILAALLGRRYCGMDLRPEQIEANRDQAAAIVPDAAPDWRCGDATDLLPFAPPADFLFSCPPYGDLERYSDDPRDLSTMEYPAFVKALGRIVGSAVARLAPNRFACFTVGDFRDKKGHYRNFVSDTIAAFRSAGCELYNEAILVTQVGSLPVRVGKQWAAGRKLGKTHQNVLVFVKGDWRKAAAAVEGKP